MNTVVGKSVDIIKRRKFIGLGVALGGLALLGSAAGLFGGSNRGRLFTLRTGRNKSVIDQDSIFYPRDEVVRKKIAESGDLGRT